MVYTHHTDIHTFAFRFRRRNQRGVGSWTVDTCQFSGLDHGQKWLLYVAVLVYGGEKEVHSGEKRRLFWCCFLLNIEVIHGEIMWNHGEWSNIVDSLVAKNGWSQLMVLGKVITVDSLCQLWFFTAAQKQSTACLSDEEAAWMVKCSPKVYYHVVYSVDGFNHFYFPQYLGMVGWLIDSYFSEGY